MNKDLVIRAKELSVNIAYVLNQAFAKLGMEWQAQINAVVSDVMPQILLYNHTMWAVGTTPAAYLEFGETEKHTITGVKPHLEASMYIVTHEDDRDTGQQTDSKTLGYWNSMNLYGMCTDICTQLARIRIEAEVYSSLSIPDKVPS